MNFPDKSYDCIVIGCGPAGSMAARTLSRAGCKVLALDRKKEVGVPVQCGEAVSLRTISYAGLEDAGVSIVHEVDGCTVRSPSGNELFFRNPGACIDRAAFDRALSDSARSAGAEMVLGTRVTEISGKDGSFKVRTHHGAIGTRSVILACGPESDLPSDVGLSKNTEMVKAVNVKVRRKDDGDRLLFLVRGNFRGGYGWYFPRLDEVNIGYCGPVSARDGLSQVLSYFHVRKDEIISYHGGTIPTGGMLTTVQRPGIALVGDAGGFVHPVSKGGIQGALLSARTIADAMASHLSGDDMALAGAVEGLKKHVGFGWRNLSRARALSSLNDRQLDDLASTVEGVSVHDIPRRTLFRRVLARPSLFAFFIRSIPSLEGSIRWTDHSW